MIKKTLENTDKLIGKLLPSIFLIISYALIMVQDTSRMYWPYIICTYIIGAGVYYFGQHKKEASLIGYLFPRKIWLHESSINDYTLFIFNFFIYFHLIILFISEPLFLQHWASTVMSWLHIPQSTAAPTLTAGIAFTIFTLLATELAYYITHRAYHEIPFLWELHKVHHSAEVMTPLTFIRAHPLDIFIQNIMKLSAITISSGIFLYMYPNLEGMIMVAGIDAGMFFFYIIGGNLHHSHIWLSFGNKVEHILISPAQHQVHHSDNPKHYDKNYGSMLALWDWLFGSLYLVEKNEQIQFGLGNQKDQKNYNSTLKLLYHPMKQMALILIKPLRKQKRPRQPPLHKKS